jgi:hypothetical protein
MRPIRCFSIKQPPVVAVTTWDSGAMGSGIALSSGDLHAAKAGGGWATVFGTMGKGAGKWQFEIVGRSATIYMFAGIADKSNLAGALATYIGDNSGVVETAGYWNNGFEYHNLTGGAGNSGRPTWSNTDIITVTLDMTAPEARFYRNGVFVYTLALPSGKTWYPATSIQSGGEVDLVPSALTYPQSGFSDWG